MKSLVQRVLLRATASPWLIPVVGLGILRGIDDWLVDQIGLRYASGIVIAVGAVLGWLWYVGTPRPLAERLYPFVLLGAAATVLTVFADGSVVDVPGVYSLAGIVGGLVLAERFPVSWKRQPNTAVSTRQSMSEHP